MSDTHSERIDELIRDRLLLAHFISGVTPDRNVQTEAEADAVEQKVMKIVKRAQQEANDEWLQL